jgi:hypothetical protein
MRRRQILPFLISAVPISFLGCGHAALAHGCHQVGAMDRDFGHHAHGPAPECKVRPLGSLDVPSMNVPTSPKKDLPDEKKDVPPKN